MLIPLPLAGKHYIKGAPEYILDDGGELNQQKTIATTGGIYEVALGYAANTNEKFFYGVTLGIPIVSYMRNTYFREEDATGDTNNGFGYSELNDQVQNHWCRIERKTGNDV